MADVAEAIAAALAAATAPTPTTPQIKTEELPASDPMNLDPNPLSPQSPTAKRPRTADGYGEPRDEKRLKMEIYGGDEMDEFARLVQQAEASVMEQFQPDPNRTNSFPTNDFDHFHDMHHDISHDIPHDVSHDMPSFGPIAEPQSSTPIDNVEPRPESLWSNPRDFTRRKHIIPALGSLAVDIITAWSEQSLEDTIATLSGESDSDIAKEYALLKIAFDAQRKLLSNSHPLLVPEQLNVTSETREVIRIVNLATACASVFGTNELGLEEIDYHFLHIFIPQNQEIPRDAADLYLGLKTQIFLAVLEGEQGKARDRQLDDLFITRLEEDLIAHHPSLPLTAAEHEFLANAKARRAMLWNESADLDSIHALGKQFTYEAFLDTLSTFLNDHIETIRTQGTGKVETTAAIEDNIHDEHADQNLDDTFDINAMIAEASRAAQSALETAGDTSNELDDISAFLAENVSKAVERAKESATSTELPSAIASAAESAERATILALQSIQQNQYQPTALPQSTTQSQSQSQSQSHSQSHPTPTPTPNPISNHNYQPQPQAQPQPQPQPQPQQQHYHYQQHPPTNGMHPYEAPNGHLPPNQSDSTPALYERARQAAAARSSTHARREGSHSTRRPWGPEEEKALMLGLDMVKGPHWSQILSLFGPNGSVSNILADRTQVQLKDKARNLKLFFLKTNSEMPYYLQCVTGELKTRAPTQAARKEAEEKARINSEEQQAHVNGILTLANGLQSNASSAHTPSATAPPRSATPGQPVSHPGSRPGTPRVSQQPIQTSAPTPAPTAAPVALPRPIIPAPQPVSLPTLTSTAHQHAQPSPMSHVERHVTPSTAPSVSPVTATMTPVSASMTASVPPPLSEHHELDKSGLSSIDAAVLGLKAALDRERERDSAAASTPVPPAGNAEEAPTHSSASATSAATTLQP
ncbi:telomere repeat binding factor-domain-containing protein [Hypoxylon sp. FL1150]|nr:telomere repeat binding factor-domain-containing protein [Hypoxylon sp. FL1150]